MDPAITLAELVTAHPAAARVLHRHRLDFCCDGERTLVAACHRRGLDPQALLAEIEGAVPDTSERRPSALPPERLVDFIVERYHVPLREELPRLAELARKVEHVHAGKPLCPAGLAHHLDDMCRAVDEHLAKEEQILFPMIRAGRGHLAHMPVRVMIQEHQDHAASLARTRALAHELDLPESACTSWRLLYDGLRALELELMEHIHLENHVLFPAVLNVRGA
jgi:regulator of cell morphogenesis and NO signaling